MHLSNPPIPFQIQESKQDPLYSTDFRHFNGFSTGLGIRLAQVLFQMRLKRK